MSTAEPLPLAPGSLFLSEIREQPLALARLLEHADEYAAVADLARRRGLATVRMVGHGSSDNAASYGVYAFGLLPAWTALRDSISLSVYYGAEIDLSGSCVLALSQSGRTPDVVRYVERARARGALTIAITNEPESELADAAEAVLPLSAGPEHAVAATKTYTTQLAAIALLAGHAAGRGADVRDGLAAVAELLDERLRNRGGSGRDQHAIVRGMLRPTEVAVSDADVHVAIAERRERLRCARGQRLDDLDTVNFRCDLGKDRRLVAAAHADLEHARARRDAQHLGHERDDVRL
jgi:hypothetical protein